MMRRRIFLWMGLGVLFASLGLCREGLARETYQVLSGDTLSAIAEKTGVTVDALKAANQLKSSQPQASSDPRHPRFQQSTISIVEITNLLHHPRGASLSVVKGDTLARIARKTGVSVAELRELNRLQGSALKIGQKLALSQRTGSGCGAGGTDEGSGAP